MIWLESLETILYTEYSLSQTRRSADDTASEVAIAEVEQSLKMNELLRRLMQQQQQQQQQWRRGPEALQTAIDDVIAEDQDKDERKRGDARRCFYHAVNCW